jgi:hypothetical protein
MSPRLLRPRAAGGFDPRTIGGLALWLDAADVSTISLDGSSNVEQWRDKSGFGRHAAQTTAANRPDYAGTRNGRSVVSFAGDPERMATASFTQNQPSTMFLVARWTNGAVGNSAGNAVDGVGSNRASIYRRVTNNWAMFAGTELFGGTPDANWHVFVAAFNTTSSVLRVDASQLASGNAGSQNITQGLSIASIGAASFLIGNIAEIILYGGALSASPVSAVEKYLQNKWGLQ